MEQQKLPNATLIIVLSIASFLCCCFYGIGIITAVIALVLAFNSQKIYNSNPEDYSNIGTIKTGKIISIIAIVVNLAFIGFVIWLISELGLEVLQSGDQELIQEKMQELFGQ
ncbi:CCC motif membrane protein [Cellulophaga baltica]|uniref:CCC motif membrane protein n=1 Tax=Cellulophaga baltica TaxID=76594 RepID=UPI00249450D7|nr:CCC motif membrane protein [Cellulophaga baltica]